MAHEASSLIGSGTTEFTKNILSPAQRGSNPETRGGFRTGTQVMVGNPEDLLAVDAWATSGVIVGTTPVQIFGPHINTLPRTRLVILENVGLNDLYIAPTEAGATAVDGFTIPAAQASGIFAAGTIPRVKLPLLHNNEIWAAASAGITTVKMITY